MWRTIPTRVGRTGAGNDSRITSPDHPHACGENYLNKETHICQNGPSPRVWGELAQPVVFEYARWTIPTRVGRTGRLMAGPPLPPDHPHACGENLHFYPERAHCFGPSPRVWGELDNLLPQRRIQRTIPTRVGRTAHTTFSRWYISDHPHACGENLLYFCDL